MALVWPVLESFCVGSPEVWTVAHVEISIASSSSGAEPGTKGPPALTEAERQSPAQIQEPSVFPLEAFICGTRGANPKQSAQRT